MSPLRNSTSKDRFATRQADSTIDNVGTGSGARTSSLSGKVIRLVPDRGFGFIAAEGDGTEYFFHWSAVIGGRDGFDIIEQFDPVEFTPTKTEKGLRAVDVRMIRE